MYGKDKENEDEGEKAWIGKVPIMLKSAFCNLSNIDQRKLTELNECPFDQVSYTKFS